jgi:hypothetical protein
MANILARMTRGEHLKYCIAFALGGASTIVRGMWRTLTDQERMAVANRAVDKLKEHGNKWRPDEQESVSPLDGLMRARAASRKRIVKSRNGLDGFSRFLESAYSTLSHEHIIEPDNYERG